MKCIQYNRSHHITIFIVKDIAVLYTLQNQLQEHKKTKQTEIRVEIKITMNVIRKNSLAFQFKKLSSDTAKSNF